MSRLLISLSVAIAAYMAGCSSLDTHKPQQVKVLPDISQDRLFGQEILFRNQDISFLEKDDALVADFVDSNQCKILVYATPSDCNDCQMRLGEWKIKLKELLLRELNVEFIYIVWSRDYHAFEHYAGHMMPNYRFVYDRRGDFFKLNRNCLIESPYTWLLDKDNRIILTGSPLGDAKMWALYKETIAKLSADRGELPDGTE